MFEIQIYSLLLFLSSGFLIAVFYESKVAEGWIWKEELTQAGFSCPLAVLLMIGAAIWGAWFKSLDLALISSLVICHLLITPLLFGVSLRSLLRVTTKTALSLSLYVGVVCLILVAFRRPIPDPFGCIPESIKAWLALFGIGAFGAFLTRVLARICALIKRASGGLLRSITGMVKCAVCLRRNAHSTGIVNTLHFLPGESHSAVDEDYWQELADFRRTEAENYFKSFPNLE